jgi:NADH-quinone oxidoreductase subunit J
MMLDINFLELRRGFLQYLPVGALIGLVLLVELVLLFGAWVISPEATAAGRSPIPPAEQVTNTHALGAVLYTDYIYLFQAAGLILLVAMIGAIVLTHRSREGVHRQSIAAQVARRPQDTIEIRKVPTGSGV